MVSSVTLVDSEMSVPTHSQPRRIASGLNESSRTVLPTPRSPVSTKFSMIVVCRSSLRNSWRSACLPARYGGGWPAPGRNGFEKSAMAILTSVNC